MATLSARVLAAALLEGDHLGPAALLDHLGGHRGALDRRGPDRGRIAAHHQHLAELDDLARLAFDLLDLQEVLGGDAVLLPAGLDDCEHRSCPSCSNTRCSVGYGLASFCWLSFSSLLIFCCVDCSTTC